MPVERPYWRMNRIYHDMRRGFGNTLANVHPNVTIMFHKTIIRSHKELAKVAADHYLDRNSRALSVFRKAIVISNVLAGINHVEGARFIWFNLNLSRLMPAYLSSHHLEHFIDDLLTDLGKVTDDKEYAKRFYNKVKFLYGIGALDIEGDGVQVQKHSKTSSAQFELPLFFLRPLPDGLYFPSGMNEPAPTKVRFINGEPEYSW